VVTLTPTFIEANDQSERERDVIVEIEDVTFSDEKTTEADWGNNVVEIQVDYTSSPDDVLLEAITPLDEENLTGNTWGVLKHIIFTGGTPSGGVDNQNWQSFKQISGFKELNIVKGYILIGGGGTNYRVDCSIWDSAKTTQQGTTLSVVPASGTGVWETFDFSAQGIDIEHDTEYWIKFEGFFTPAQPDGTTFIQQKYQNTDVYANGQFDRTGTSPGTDLGDLMFENSFTGVFYEELGFIRTDNLDVGIVPTDFGEWIIEDIRPDDSSISYLAWYSATGAFTGEQVLIGAIEDGDEITDLARYWRVQASLVANTIRDETPTLQSIRIEFPTFRKFNKYPDLGYEPLVDNVSSLTSRIDFFDPSSIGQVSVSIMMTDIISDWIYDITPYNKVVKVKLGFIYPGFAESDYMDYFRGAVDDWSVDNNILTLTLKDLSKTWKLPVPSKWENEEDDDVVYTGEHHIDVILDVLKNQINVRDSTLVGSTFTTVKAATSSYEVTRTITGKTEDAKKLVEELRVLLFAYFIPSGDGKIGIKQFDKTEASAVSFNDDNTISIKWKANADSLINRTSLYFDWDADGDGEVNFLKYDPGDDTTSQAKFQEIAPHSLKDKWTRAAEATQISALETKILDQFDDMPSEVEVISDAKDIAYEVGDMMDITTLEAPGNNGTGIVDEKYLIVSKNLDFLGDKIKFIGLRVAV
jgi:hypothetical protein